MSVSWSERVCLLRCMRLLRFICLQKSRELFYIILSMPAAPLGSFENLKRNSGGFFCAQCQDFTAAGRGCA